MRAFCAAVGAVVLLCSGIVWYQHQQASLLQFQVDEMTRERAVAAAETRALNARLIDLEARVATATATAAARAAASSPSPAAAKEVDKVSAPPQPQPRPGVTVDAPAGWGKNGAKPEMYAVGVDSTQSWGGMPSAYVESLTPSVEKGFGGMMQTAAAQDYEGKRVRLSGWIKTEEANEGGGHLWLRIDGQERGQTLGFDNMNNRAVTGTSDWQEASLVLDVPAGAKALAYGFFVQGGGKMWVNGQRVEVVGQDVPTTNMITRPAAPRNLGFDPNRPK